MNQSDTTRSIQASERFQRARRRQLFSDLLSLVRGRSPELLSFEAVQVALKTWQQVEKRRPEVIPLDKIVGSVGRYRDFNREFLPKKSVSEQRWKAVDAAMHGAMGLPPIELYQIGDVYFVRDGNHRVSVARANGLTDIEAYVTRLETTVSITTETRVEDLALKAAYADFLRQAQLDQLRPDADLEVTEVGSYHELLLHIEVHRHYLGLEQQREISFAEAVISWYDRVYLPVAAAIWVSDIMEKFPERTAADLYLWVCRHREELARQSDELPTPVATVTDLVENGQDKPAMRVVNTVKRVLKAAGKEGDLAAEATRAAKDQADGADEPSS